MKGFWIGLLVGLSVTAAIAQAQQPAGQFQQMLAAKVDALGKCNSELGQLQQLSAKVLAGQLVAPAVTTAANRAAFEQSNHGRTVDDTWKVVDKKKEGTGKNP